MRDNALHLERGTPVLTTDGDKIGAIDRIVFDPKAQRVTDNVVSIGMLLKTDRVIPANALAPADIGGRTKRPLPARLVMLIAENEAHLGFDSSEIGEYVIVD